MSIDTRVRRRSAGLPVVAYAAVLFVLATVLVAVVSLTLDRNARSSDSNQAGAALAGAARVAGASVDNLRSNLRVNVSQLATSLPLQRAIVAGDRAALEQFAKSRHAEIRVGNATFGTLPPAPRVSSSATIAFDQRVLARVAIGVTLGDDVLALISRTTPLPAHGALLFARGDHVIAGAKRSSRIEIVGGRTTIGGTLFAARSKRLGASGVSVVAVQPVSAIDEVSLRYRRLVLIAALATLVLVAAVAMRLARPFAHAVSEVGRLTHQAQTDPLTGLANRRVLDERMSHEMARPEAEETRLSYVMLDIDDFKLINDEFGHPFGDEVIHAVAQALRASVRELDLPARYGGEEFAVILPDVRLSDAKEAAERIRQAIEDVRMIGPDGRPVRVTASFGIAEFPTYPTVEAVVGAADAALYQAKRTGKNSVAVATVEGGAPAEERPAPSLVVAG